MRDHLIISHTRFPQAFAGDDTRIEFRREQIDRGYISTVNHQGRSASMLNSTALSAHPVFGPYVNPLDGQIAASFERLADLNRDGYTGAALAREIDIQLARVKPVLRTAIDGVREIRGNLQLRRVRGMSFDHSEGAPLRADLRQWFLSHGPSERIKLAMSADWNLAVALIEVGREYCGLEPEIWVRVEDRFMALNHVRVAGLDASYVIASTTELLTGAGTDHAGAFAVAEMAVRDYHEEIALLELAEDYFQSVVKALMLVSGEPAHEIVGVGD